MGEYISIKDLIQVLLKNKSRIFYAAIIGAFIGLLVGLLSPNEYHSKALLLPSPTDESGINGNLASIAGLAGVNLNSSPSYSLGSEMYSRIIKSVPFAITILGTEFSYKKEENRVVLYQYFQDHYQKGVFSHILKLPNTVLGLFKKEAIMTIPQFDPESFVSLTEGQEGLIAELNSRISVEIDYTTNVVQLSVKMQDPLLAAHIAKFTLNYLNNYIINFKTEKLKENLSFVDKQTEDANAKYLEAQKQLANFKDSNLMLTTAASQISEKRLENELNRTFEIYNFLSKEREKLRIEIQEQTSAFKIIDPVNIPADESSPKKMLLIIVIAILSTIMTALYLIINEILLTD